MMWKDPLFGSGEDGNIIKTGDICAKVFVTGMVGTMEYGSTRE
jgi:hypothetical protein